MTTSTPVFVRTSERTQFTKCRQSWWWSYKEQRKPNEAFSHPLIFGDMIHRALAEYYVPETRKERRRGPHPSQTFHRIYNEMDRRAKDFNIHVDDERWVNTLELGVAMLEGYIDKWKDEDEDILVLYPEMPFQLDLDDPDTGEYLCTYVGTTDSLVMRMSTRQVGLLEHKTAATISTSHLFIDEQASTYWTLIPEWLLRNEIFPRGKMPEFSFMLYNYLRKGMPEDRPVNDQGQALNKPTKEDLVQALAAKGVSAVSGKPTAKLTKEALETYCATVGIDPEKCGQVSKQQPPPLFHREMVYRGDFERQMTFERIVQQVREMNLVRRGKMPHYKAPSKDCSWCEWRDLCELHETGNDWRELRKYTTHKWEPYRDHVWSLDLGGSR
jgi:hypothetical protein